MVRNLFLVVALASAGCAADFVAALHVSIDGPALEAGGYWVDLRQPDGRAVDGIIRKFVEFAPGKQDVALVLHQGSFFGSNDSRLVRLLVDAVPQRDAAVLARGAQLVEVDRDEILELSVILIDDPRPLPNPVSVAYDGAAGTVTLDTASLPGERIFDLWSDASEPVWLERLSVGSATLDLDSHRAIIADNGLQLLVTEEPAGSQELLVRSSGWPVLRGAMPTGLVEALITAPYAEDGIFAAMQSALDTAEAHRGFALTSKSNDNEDDVVVHCEHVYSTLAGEAVAETDSGSGKEGDLSGDGNVLYAGDDATGVGPGTLAAPGYLRRLSTALAELEAVLNVEDALTCTSSIDAAVTGALEATRELAADPLGAPALASAFDGAVMLVRGAPHDDGAVGSADQTTLCALAELETLADFELEPLDAGTD